MSQVINKGDRIRVKSFEAIASGHVDDGRVRFYTEGSFSWGWLPVESVEKLDPEPKFKVGDRVLPVPGAWNLEPGRVYTVLAHQRNHYPEAQPDHPWLIQVKEGGPFHFEEHFEPAPDQTFKLKAGDKIRNTKSGRVGTVYRSVDLKQLAVYDPKDWPSPQKSRVPAAAVEEYEEHRPGTYEIISRADGSPF